tara:strand:+ start:793 stop:969 length:177 start_codon:yes stop_codon:yes gene_type:complete
MLVAVAVAQIQEQHQPLLPVLVMVVIMAVHLLRRELIPEVAAVLQGLVVGQQLRVALV